MIDLHLHLDGSLSEEDFAFFADKEKIKLDKNLDKLIRVNKTCKSLDEYLKCFDLPLKLMQNRENIKEIVKNLIIRLYKMDYIYAEIRFAPQLHMQNGLTQNDVVKAACDGLKEGLKLCPGFIAGLILCCMRHATVEVNLDTIKAAIKFKHKGVRGVDLAGGESLHCCDYYSSCFALAKRKKLHITIHAGEALGNEEIMKAIDLGPSRIGHGVHLSLDNESIKKVKENNITFEFCPTSNLQTKSLKNYLSVPLKEFIKNGIRVTINSDNMTVSDTNQINEMKAMASTFKLEKQEIKQLLINAINSSFTNKHEKNILFKNLEEKFESYYKKLI